MAHPSCAGSGCASVKPDGTIDTAGSSTAPRNMRKRPDAEGAFAAAGALPALSDGLQELSSNVMQQARMWPDDAG